MVILRALALSLDGRRLIDHVDAKLKVLSRAGAKRYQAVLVARKPALMRATDVSHEFVQCSMLNLQMLHRLWGSVDETIIFFVGGSIESNQLEYSKQHTYVT